MLNREILNIDMDMTRRSIYDIEQEVWEAIAEANGLDYEDIADGDLTEWL
jgi:dephospho-CoA kinase